MVPFEQINFANGPNELVLRKPLQISCSREQQIYRDLGDNSQSENKPLALRIIARILYCNSRT